MRNVIQTPACLQVDLGGGESLGDNSAAAPLSDDAIAQLLQQHLSISPAAFLQAAQQQPPHTGSTGSKGPQQHTAKGPAKQPRAGGSGPKQGQVAGYASVEAFVGVMAKLLDMEREAEVAAAQEATSQCSTTAAQVGDTACSWVGFEPPHHALQWAVTMTMRAAQPSGLSVTARQH